MGGYGGRGFERIGSNRVRRGWIMGWGVLRWRIHGWGLERVGSNSERRKMGNVVGRGWVVGWGVLRRNIRGGSGV